MGYMLYVSLFTVVIFSGNRHGALLRVNIILLTIFVVKSSHNHVLSRNVCIFMVLERLETPNYHCIAIVRMITNIYSVFQFEIYSFRMFAFNYLYLFCSSSDLCAFINH